MSQSFVIDLLSPIENEAKTPKQKQNAPLQAVGKIEWLMTHHFPSKLKKSPIPITVSSSSRGIIEDNHSQEDDDHTKQQQGNESTPFNPESWEKGVWSALKKVVVADLGNMNASELKDSIPEEDSEGRGMNDLVKYEKKLAVKVVFDDSSGHVLLVGDQKKLDKKVFVLRNMISHYHWRLSGTDVAFDEATSNKK